MAVNPCILTLSGEKLRVVGPDAGGHPIELTRSILGGDDKRPRYGILCVPGEYYGRRSHAKPFHHRRKLARILPGLIADNLFADPETARHTFTPGPENARRFSSFSLPHAQIDGLLDTVAEQFSPLIWAVPEAAGLAALAPEKGDFVLLNLSGERVLAVACHDGEVVDFRVLTFDLWKEQAVLTLHTWADRLGSDFKVITSHQHLISAPWKETAMEFAVPASLDPALYPAFGLFHQIKKEKPLPLALPVTDPTTRRTHSGFAARLAPVLGWGIAATALAFLAGAWQNANIEKQLASSEAAIETAFSETMPGVPAVDPLLQLQRRADALAFYAGETGHLADQLARLLQIREDVAAAGLAPELEEVSLSPRGVVMRGRLPSLAAIEKLQGTLAESLGVATEIRSTQIQEDGRVAFVLEASLS